MAMTPEAKVKKRAVVQLKTLGAYYFYPVTGGYGKSGVPDIVACYKGLFLAGGYALIVDETNVDDLAALIMEAHDGWS